MAESASQSELVAPQYTAPSMEELLKQPKLPTGASYLREEPDVTLKLIEITARLRDEISKNKPTVIPTEEKVISQMSGRNLFDAGNYPLVKDSDGSIRPAALDDTIFVSISFEELYKKMFGVPHHIALFELTNDKPGDSEDTKRENRLKNQETIAEWFAGHRVNLYDPDKSTEVPARHFYPARIISDTGVFGTAFLARYNIEYIVKLKQDGRAEITTE